jgi:hypothetical protein
LGESGQAAQEQLTDLIAEGNALLAITVASIKTVRERSHDRVRKADDERRRRSSDPPQ